MSPHPPFKRWLLSCVMLLLAITLSVLACDPTPPTEITTEITTESSPDATAESTNPDTTAESTNPDATAESTTPDTTAESTNPDTTAESTNPDALIERPSPDAIAESTTPDAANESTTPEPQPEEPNPSDASELTPENIAESTRPEITPETPTITRITLQARILGQQTGTLLVSNGIPFAPGVLTSLTGLTLKSGNQEIAIFVKILARWQDQSIRALLLQFQRPSTQFPASLTLELNGSPQVARRAEVAVTWTLPQAVAFPDKAALCDSMVGGPLIPHSTNPTFQAYDTNQMTFYNQLKGDSGWGNDARLDGYYSTTLSWYLLFLRTGDTEVFSWARREAVHYRDDQIIQSGANAGRMNGRTEPRYLYLRAMELDYLLTGDPKTLQVSEMMAEYLYTLHPNDWYHYKKADRRFWTERRAGFALLGLLVYGRFSGKTKYIDRAKEILTKILATQAEWPDGGWLHGLYYHDSAECADQNAYGGSPFMTGLLYEGLLAAHHWLQDTRIVPAIRKSNEWLWTKGWRQTGFLYLIGCGNSYTDAAPDLNLLIAHGFAFLYWADGKKPTDLQRAQSVFQEGVKNAYLKARKQYNQNYRSSGATLYYLTK